METSIFNYGELPEFNKFTSDRINQEFPNVIKKINLDFEKIEKFLSNYLEQENLESVSYTHLTLPTILLV